MPMLEPFGIDFCCCFISLTRSNDEMILLIDFNQADSGNVLSSKYCKFWMKSKPFCNSL